MLNKLLCWLNGHRWTFHYRSGKAHRTCNECDKAERLTASGWKEDI